MDRDERQRRYDQAHAERVAKRAERLAPIEARRAERQIRYQAEHAEREAKRAARLRGR